MFENESIRLRALEPEDIDILYRWENDTSLWSNGNTLSPWSRFSLRRYIEESFQNIYEIKQLRLMIILKENFETIGAVDLFNFDPFHERAEIGILIDKNYRNRGLAEQSLLLMKGYAFQYLKIKQLYVHIPESNDTSLRLFQRCGFLISGKLQKWIKVGDTFRDVYLLQLLISQTA
ncbi:MAG: GNAT family N-acetyltransferase [Bacteroidales bacterium]|jgi:diamine N-acetyltransferase|nr:GNAT family N-acetyltransferase [Bacteroidales bacterium]